MRMQKLVSQVFQKAVREYFADSPLGVSRIPVLRRPADVASLDELKDRLDGHIESSYRDFLLVSDGMDGLPLIILGCSDWEPDGLGERAISYRDELDGIGTPQDVGVEEGVPFFPVAINEDGSDGIFMGEFALGGEYRFWWIGEGSSRFFADFYDVLAYMHDKTSYDPVETLD
ncbi:hypothetical protein [Streptomyces sp. Qhu_M48]|uniref:hypothetical protein n=1 Tax=Streptomyces sp. Qhu_M48 TaxID=3435889 RepID=UPI003F4FA38D